MKNEWIVIEIETQGKFVDLIGEVLADYGCSGTVVDEQQLDTFIVPDEELEAEGIFTLNAYFAADTDVPELLVQLQDTFDSHPFLKGGEISLQQGGIVRTEDWAESWKQNFSLFRVGEKLVIRPSWEDYTPQANEVVIEIDPGMAFGTGTHGTTQLCLEMIAELLSQPCPPQTMLDVGTGSGILALGAAALGCKDIVATDIDAIACQVAAENIERNGYNVQIKVSSEPLETLPGCFDLVVANIMAEENVRLRQSFVDHLAAGGHLVLSGILQEKEQFVRDGFADLPLDFLESRYQDEWVCLLFRGK